MKKWCGILISMVLAVGISACGNSDNADKKDGVSEKPKYKVEIEMKCEENLFFSKYDVNVLVNEEKIKTLEHGKSDTYSLELEEGKNILRVESEEDSSVSGEIEFDVSEDMKLKCELSCESDQIEIKETMEIAPPISTDELGEKKYKEVKKEFEDAGFTNVKEKAIGDLTEDQIDEEEIVTAINIGDSSSFTKKDKFMADEKVVIEYHVVENSAKSEEEKTLTSDNNSELAYILTTKDEFDPKIKEFASKYAGKMIEFDAYTADVSQNEDFKTRFNYLIYAGDYGGGSVGGPNFQFHDVNYSSLNLQGDNVPDSLGVGVNIHVIAIVGTYNEDNGLFELEPVAITMR